MFSRVAAWLAGIGWCMSAAPLQSSKLPSHQSPHLELPHDLQSEMMKI